MAEVKWIKIVPNVFDDDKIKLIETMPDGDSIIVIWFKLLCLAGKQNRDGFLMMNDKIAYTEEMLSTIFRRPINTVRLALNTFEQFEMIEIINGAIYVTNWDKHQNVDGLAQLREYNRLAQQKSRDKKRLLRGVNDDVNDMSMTCQECQGTDIDRDQEEEKESIYNMAGSANPSAPTKPKKHKYGVYKHVLLTDEEKQKLIEDYGETDTNDAITFLDEYIERKAYKSKSHYLCMRKWVYDAVKEERAKGKKKPPTESSFNVADFFDAAINKSYG